MPVSKLDSTGLSFSCRTMSCGKIWAIDRGHICISGISIRSQLVCRCIQDNLFVAIWDLSWISYTGRKQQFRVDDSLCVGRCVFTFMTFKRSDGGVCLLLQFQQRYLSWVIANEGMLRLVIVSEQGVRAETHSTCYYTADRCPCHCSHSEWMKDTVGKRPRRWSSVSPACCHSGCTSSSHSCRGQCSPPTHSPGRTPYPTHGSGGLQNTRASWVMLDKHQSRSRLFHWS